jgi:DeoD family purine-nucleoside phosphorylase
MKTIHVRPTAQLAPRLLLPGDPGRALALAQELLHQPKMFNHNRGLWGYTGSAKADELPLTIQSTGMGGPSAAIVLHELVKLGARTAIRVGTCGALLPSLRLGDLVVARAAIAADGVGGHLARHGAAHAAQQDPEPVVQAHPALSHALEVAAQPAAGGIIVTTDLFYEPSRSGREQRWRSAGALAVEMEAAALFAVGAELGIAVGCLLAVSDVFDADGRHHADDEPLQHAAMRMGAAALTALSGAA